MNGYWNDWYAGWGWFLWLGLVIVLVSSTANWGYTYHAHRRLSDFYPGKTALDILKERYARGELSRDEFKRMRDDISEKLQAADEKKAA